MVNHRLPHTVLLHLDHEGYCHAWGTITRDETGDIVSQQVTPHQLPTGPYSALEEALVRLVEQGEVLTLF